MQQIRAIRASLNKLLQPCTTVEQVKRGGAEFEAEHGPSIWGCVGIYSHETFADVYNAHLQRCIENEESEEADKARLPGIRNEINNCGNLLAFGDIKAFVERMPTLQDDAQVLWELGELGLQLGHPDYLDDGGMP